jgi:hypothetical protein
MQIATFVVAVYAAVVATAALAWQGALYLLTGGRVRVEMRLGAMGRGGMFHCDPENFTVQQLERMQSQGYTKPVLIVFVRNVGRLPVSVESWHVETGVKISLRPLAETVGPDLPHTLQPGQSESWAVGLAFVLDSVKTAVDVFDGVTQESVRITPAVSLGDGRTIRAAQSWRP